MESFDIDFGQMLNETLHASERVSKLRKGGEGASQTPLQQDFFETESLQSWLQDNRLERENLWNPDVIEGHSTFDGSGDEQQFERPVFSKAEWLPKAPGLIYLIEKGQNTFCIRGIPVSDIDETITKIRSRPDMLSGWQGALFAPDDDSSLEKLSKQLLYFQTPSLELAEILQDHLVNRRFPYEEDVLCNVSDPGFSWWLDDRGNEFSIYFKSYGINRIQSQRRLGPIGDAKISSGRFMAMQDIFRTIFPVRDYSITDREMRLAPLSATNAKYIELKDLLIEGKFAWGLQDFPSTRQGRTLYYFFREMACSRRFWLSIEENLR